MGMKKFTFTMHDAWGDDYELDVRAESEQKARSIANIVDDDAVSDELLKVDDDNT